MSEPLPRSPLLPATGSEREQLMRLRFDRLVERDFRKDYEAGARNARVILHLLALAMVASTALYDRWLLGMPDAFAPAARAIQFGLMVPALLVSLLFAWAYRFRTWSEPATIVAMLAVVGGLALQRHFGARFGFDVPAVFPALALTATLTLARLRLFYLLPWVAAAVAGTTIAELVRTHGAPASVYGCIANVMLVAMSVMAAWFVEHSSRWNWLNGRQLEQQAARDALTGLPNRRHFDAMLVRLVREAARERKNVALLMLDVDDFKAYNDRYGHPAGDECLRQISRCLGENMRRPQDFCARLGGEEFGAVWFNASARDAPRLAEELREGIARLNIPHLAARARRVVTASGGFVQVVAPNSEDEAATLAADLIERADRALYEAKRAGRSRLVISGPSPVLRREDPQTEEIPSTGTRGPR